jgi:membrane associated rhomboid family serine protease
MIPLRDSLPARLPPVVTRGLLAFNIIVFTVQVMAGPFGDLYVRAFGFIPARLFHPSAFGDSVPEVLPMLVTSLFLHGGVMHIAGNLVYLWIFGRRVEAAFGHWPYLLFYLACGAAGSLTHAFLFPLSVIPSIGASGCIAGVLGAYLVLYPRARIVTLFPLVLYWAMAEIPAVVLLPVWFAMQFVNGWMALAATTNVQEVAGVAWWAHIGGFVFGAAVGLWVRAGRQAALPAA